MEALDKDKLYQTKDMQKPAAEGRPGRDPPALPRGDDARILGATVKIQ